MPAPSFEHRGSNMVKSCQITSYGDPDGTKGDNTGGSNHGVALLPQCLDSRPKGALVGVAICPLFDSADVHVQWFLVKQTTWLTHHQHQLGHDACQECLVIICQVGRHHCCCPGGLRIDPLTLVSPRARCHDPRTDVSRPRWAEKKQKNNGDPSTTGIF